MQTLILKRPLLMAVFGLVSMQQITYHMKVRPPLRTLTTLIPTPVLDVLLGRAVQCVSPEPPRPSPSTGQHYMTEPSSLNSGYSDRPVVLSPDEGKSMGEVLKSGDPVHPRVLIKASRSYR
ncbi:CheY-like superfamily [Penicillium chrysogenum]|uniref:CheY-like superfamily n=1 Tax=Penicillium chrysogenum TaxID=5076 RepID=UPI0024DF1991|nr:CheY-like superfamily [Penicillium chrysogenum]KAJ5243791.1 CheY-like superfamily [Penicillium chrysogenum]KAJ6140868.1 CheY-like superfamily [Penicillium chrysogenum]